MATAPPDWRSSAQLAGVFLFALMFSREPVHDEGKIMMNMIFNQFKIIHWIAFISSAALATILTIASLDSVQEVRAQGQPSDKITCSPPAGYTLARSIELVPAIPAAPSANQPRGEFKKIDFDFILAGSEMLCLSSTPDGRGELQVDDYLDLQLRHNDNSTASWQIDFYDPNRGGPGIQGIRAYPPQDITRHFKTGFNSGTIRLVDFFPNSYSAFPIRLVVWTQPPTVVPNVTRAVPTNAPTPPATPTPPPPDNRLTIRGSPNREIDLGTFEIPQVGIITVNPLDASVGLIWSDQAVKNKIGVNAELQLSAENRSLIQIPAQWYLQPEGTLDKAPNLRLTTDNKSFKIGLDLTRNFAAPDLTGCWPYRGRVVFTDKGTIIDGDVANPANEPPYFEVTFRACQPWPWWVLALVAVFILGLIVIATRPRFPL